MQQTPHLVLSLNPPPPHPMKEPKPQSRFSVRDKIFLEENRCTVFDQPPPFTTPKSCLNRKNPKQLRVVDTSGIPQPLLSVPPHPKYHLKEKPEKLINWHLLGLFFSSLHRIHERKELKIYSYRTIRVIVKTDYSVVQCGARFTVPSSLRLSGEPITSFRFEPCLAKVRLFWSPLGGTSAPYYLYRTLRVTEAVISFP